MLDLDPVSPRQRGTGRPDADWRARRRPPPAGHRGRDRDGGVAAFSLNRRYCGAVNNTNSRAQIRYNRPSQAARLHNGFFIEPGAAADPGRGPQALRPIRRRLLAGKGPQRRVSARAARRDRRGRLARHRDAGRIWRSRSRRHRSRDHDAGDRRIRCRHERSVGGSHQYFRPPAGRRVRNRRTEAPHAAAADRRPGQGLLCRDRARRWSRYHGHQYVLSGQKIWISTAQVANKILILARTTPLDRVKRKTDGLSLFYTDLDRTRVAVRVIDKMGRHAVDSNEMFFDAMVIPEADRIGAEGDGFRSILHGMNPERILIAAEAVGIGLAALRKAAGYARERVVFRRPIGQNQAIAHPLAQCWMNLEAANLMVMKAATLYDRNLDCAAEANAAKYLAAEAAFHACETAVLTLGGMGYSKEFHVERYLREVMIPRIAPITPHMILNFIAEKVLGLPKSY